MSGPGDASVRDLAAVYGLWRRQAVWLIAGVVCAMAAAGAAVALTTGSGRSVAFALIAGAAAPALWLQMVAAARVVLRYLDRLLSHSATFRALADLRVWFFRGLALRSAGGLGFRRSGDVLSRLVSDVEALDGLYLRITIPAAIALMLMVAVPWMLWRNGALLACAITGLFISAAIVLPWRQAVSSMRDATRLAESGAATRIAALDLLGGLREARAFGAEQRLLAVLTRREAEQQAALEGLNRRGARAQAASGLCAQAAVLLVLAATVLQGRTNPVATVAMLFLTVAAFEAVSGLPRAGTLAGHAAAAARRVMQAGAGPVQTPPPAAPAPLPAGVSLRFEQVGFTWQPDRPAVLEGFTLEVPRGARVAVLGASGTGKSTLAALALRVMLPQTGRVLLGGTDIARLSPEAVRSRFSWLSQSTHLFDDTIRANLLLGRPDADELLLWEALDAARIGDFVRGLPGQLDAWLGEGGQAASGGQGRRLALARALLSAAPVLIMDEPCAGLDAQTEMEFLATLNEVTAGRSVLLLTHRLTGVEKLDRIYRISAGRAIAAAG